MYGVNAPDIKTHITVSVPGKHNKKQILAATGKILLQILYVDH